MIVLHGQLFGQCHAKSPTQIPAYIVSKCKKMSWLAVLIKNVHV